MAKVSIDKETCKGCGLCIEACKKDVLELSKDKLNSKGYHACVPARIENCIGCAMCAQMCPDVAITVVANG